MRRKGVKRSSPWALVPLVVLGCLVLLATGRPASAQEISYWGSDTCGTAGCHLDIYNEFRQSGHPYVLVDAASAMVRPIPLPVNLTWNDVSYVVGGYKWRSLYLDQDGYIITQVDTDGDGEPDTDGMNQWNYLTRRWVDFYPGEMKPYDCGACHSTGWVADEDFDIDNDLTDNQDERPGIHGTFALAGVQCEACHGPQARGPFGEEGHGYIDESADLCGSCHGQSPLDTIAASDGFVLYNQQYNELLASPHVNLDCVSCHDPHEQGESSIHTVCADCHANIAESYAGTEMDQWNVACEDCHLAKAGKLADSTGPHRGDIRTHLFRINTDADGQMFTGDGNFVALDGAGHGKITLDFACLSCHQTKSLTWAAFHANDFHGTDTADDLPGRNKWVGLWGIFF